MKKKLVLAILALGAASMLCGFDSAETAEGVLEKMSENSAAMESMSSNFGVNCDVAVEIGDGTTTSSIAVLVTADFDIQATLDPLATALDGSMTISTFGQGETIDMEMYMITGDDTLDTYIYMLDSTTDEDGEGSWQYSSTSLEDYDLQELIDLSSSIEYGELSDWGLDFELASEAIDYEGTECYLLSTIIDSSNLSTLIEKSEELVEDLTGEELLDEEDTDTLDYMLSYLDGLQINIDYYVDAETYLPVAFHMDLNNSDLTVLNDYLAAMLGAYDDEEYTTTVNIVLNDLSMDYTMSYDDVEEITVPEEALEAIASGEAEDLGDLTEDLDELTGGEDDYDYEDDYADDADDYTDDADDSYDSADDADDYTDDADESPEDAQEA
ncbi:MAG: hypothetical protein LUI13_14070 [Lachnospiraceae bacterium]|nr:hypothetical protein [Lachnospiraceae bacterium]